MSAVVTSAEFFGLTHAEPKGDVDLFICEGCDVTTEVDRNRFIAPTEFGQLHGFIPESRSMEAARGLCSCGEEFPRALPDAPKWLGGSAVGVARVHPFLG